MLRFSIHTQTVFMMSALFLCLVAGCERSSPPASSPAPLAEEPVAQAQPSPVPPETPSEPPTAKESAVVAANQPAAQEESQEEVGAADVAAAAADTRFIAYYFHRTLRCPTCLAIEEQAREAVEEGYEEELAAGKLEWHAVNIEEPGNEHFEDDFGLSTSSLVLVQMKGDEVVRWKDLAKVWELVREEPAFQKYVWTEVTAFLGL
jgi:hypothetical protein